MKIDYLFYRNSISFESSHYYDVLNYINVIGHGGHFEMFYQRRTIRYESTAGIYHQTIKLRLVHFYI